MMPKRVDPAELAVAVERNRQAILASPSYRLAEEDFDFIGRPDQRPVRMQLELDKAETVLREGKIRSTVVVFGGTQIVERELAEARLAVAKQLLKRHPDDPKAKRDVARAESILAKCHYYDAAREFGRLVSEFCTSPEEDTDKCDLVVMTGGGPGIMEAANRGAFEVGGLSIGMNIDLPQIQQANRYTTPGLSLRFRYFALRKLHFLLRARAMVAFPGGFGTFDELFETLTLVQTRKVKPLPVVLVGQAFWQRAVDLEFLSAQGMIRPADRKLFCYAEGARAIWTSIRAWYRRAGEPVFPQRSASPSPSRSA